MDMQLLGSALALALILEGLLPFASPKSARSVYAYLLAQTSRTIRSIGLLSMGCGLVLLKVTAGG